MADAASKGFVGSPIKSGGKVICGEFVDIEKPEYTAVLAEMQRKAKGE